MLQSFIHVLSFTKWKMKKELLFNNCTDVNKQVICHADRQIDCKSSTFLVIPCLFRLLFTDVFLFTALSLLMFKSVRTAFSKLSTATEASSSAGRACLSTLLLPSSVCFCVYVCVTGWVKATQACDLETNTEHYTQHLPTCTYMHAHVN